MAGDRLYWLILFGVFLLIEGYALAQNHIKWIEARFPRLARVLRRGPVRNIGTLSQFVWWCNSKQPTITGLVIGVLFTGLTFHFLLKGWCAP